MTRYRQLCAWQTGYRECLRPEDFNRAALRRTNSINEICLTCEVHEGKRDAPVDAKVPEQLGLF